MEKTFKFNITKKRENFLTTLKLDTPFAVLNYLPRKYLDFSLTTIDSSLDGERVVIKGNVIRKERLFRIKKNLNRFSFTLDAQDDEFKIVVFNRDFMYNNINIDSIALVAGKLDYYHREIVATDIFIKDLDKLTIKPIYSLIHGVKDYEFSKVVGYCYDQLLMENKLEGIIPFKYIDKYRLYPRKNAYHSVHFPTSLEEIRQARRYLKYEEALVYSLRMQQMKGTNEDNGTAKKVNDTLVSDFINSLPFNLTLDQEKAVEEIISDLKSDKIMYRLLQGDVGSGKTIVATIALLACISSSYQGAFMAPTDILARQHYANLTSLLKSTGINVALLVSKMSAIEKKETLRKIESGEVDLIIGTHALIQENVKYHKLGLCVIDEQHRFGVEQRKKLREKGEDVELLLMSATPIPRTLAQSVFQDLDVSSLLVPPFKNKMIETKLLTGNSVYSIKEEMQKVLDRNEKIYVVCSLIENELSDYNNVNEVYNDLKEMFKDKTDVFLLHGKLKEEEKLQVMEDFKNASSGILVSTTVIEVGIDIKEATMMIVFDANCFGLAQLHQLRGRIGRGGQHSTCYLLCNSEDAEENARLKFLSEHESGFEVARFDMNLRGPGDIIGLAQSGTLSFKMLNIFEDFKVFECAREDAKEILANPMNEENKRLIAFVKEEMAKEIAIIE